MYRKPPIGAGWSCASALRRQGDRRVATDAEAQAIANSGDPRRAEAAMRLLRLALSEDAYSGSADVDAIVTALVLAAVRPTVRARTLAWTKPFAIGGVRRFGECEGRATCRQDTCIGRIAVLKANEVDALAFVPFRSSGGRRTTATSAASTRLQKPPARRPASSSGCFERPCLPTNRDRASGPLSPAGRAGWGAGNRRRSTRGRG
jgi:hypothetical protein